MAVDRILVVVLARVRSDVERAAARLVAAADAVGDALATVEPTRVLTPVGGDSGAGRPKDLAASSEAQTLSNGVGVGGIDLVVEMTLAATVDQDRLVRALGTALAAVHDDVDALRSTVVIGPQVRILGDHGPVELVYCMYRNASVTHPEFREAWLTHAELARYTPGVVGYRQLHCDLAVTRRVNDAAGFDPTDIDGVALICFDDAAAFAEAQESSTEFSRRARDSELAFNDPTRAVAVLTHVRG